MPIANTNVTINFSPRGEAVGLLLGITILKKFGSNLPDVGKKSGAKNPWTSNQIFHPCV